MAAFFPASLPGYPSSVRAIALACAIAAGLGFSSTAFAADGDGATTTPAVKAPAKGKAKKAKKAKTKDEPAPADSTAATSAPGPGTGTGTTDAPAMATPELDKSAGIVAVDASAKAKSAPQQDEDPTAGGEPVKPTPTYSKDHVTKTEPDGSAFLAGAPQSDDESSLEFGKLNIHPYILISGGLKADFEKAAPKTVANDRVSTFMLGRLGLKAKWMDYVYVESEIMASGGVGLHGTSAYEGQAALQVRQQLIRLTRWGLMVEVGRIIDEASVDYFSAHVAESFIQDTATRDPLLFSGFDLGNGVRATYSIIPGLRIGATFNAGNPVSNTQSLLVGGAFPPQDRFYIQPYQAVGKAANNFPDDTFHSMVFNPAVLVDTSVIDARGEAQMFDINTNTASSDDDHIRGYNLRATARAKLFNKVLIPFASTAYTRNDTLVATNLALRAPDRYKAVNFGAGIDVDVARRYKCAHDCADGFGAQYQQVQFQVGEGLVTTQRYINVGGTYWLSPNVSIGARFAWWIQEAEQPVNGAAAAAGQTKPDIVNVGEKSVIAALRFIMP